MTDEQMQFEAEQMETFFGGGNKNAGMLVETKTGFTGRTFSHEDLINGKVRVYTDHGKLLCDPNSLKIIGFID